MQTGMICSRKGSNYIYETNIALPIALIDAVFIRDVD